jgi:hypothetical protein
LAATLAPPPKKLGVTHWSSRLLASHLGDVSHATVARLWQLWQLQPWRAESFKFSTDPQLIANITDIVGLYLPSICSLPWMSPPGGSTPNCTRGIAVRSSRSFSTT